MKNKDLIGILLAEVRVAISRGQKDLPLSGYETYLAGMEEIADDQGNFDSLLFEKYRAKVQADLATYQHESAQTVELLRSVVSSANEILKTLMLLNGGAAVALLAFMGHLVSSGPANAVSPFGPPLLKFVAGLVVSGLAFGAVYFVNLAFYHPSGQEGRQLASGTYDCVDAYSSWPIRVRLLHSRSSVLAGRSVCQMRHTTHPWRYAARKDIE